MEKTINNFDLSFDNLYNTTEDYQVTDLMYAIEELVRLKNETELVKLSERLVSFVNENHECFWLLVAVDQFLGKLYTQLENESYDNETEENAELFSFIEEFNSKYSEIVSEKIEFNPEEEFTVTFNTDRNTDADWRSNTDWLWSKDGGEEMTFPELIIQTADLKWSLNEEYSPAFDFEDDRAKNKYKHTAISSLWLGLREYARTFPDAEDMAICLWTVFDDAFEEMSGTGYNWEIVQTLFEKILYINFSDYNTEESDNEDLVAYDPYVHDIEKMSQELLDMDIFDFAPYDWGN